MTPEIRKNARYDVAALGELVIDMVPVSLADGRALFVAEPGGAPGNVAAGIARLGLRAAMLSKVGYGHFGNLLIQTLKRAGVDVRAIVQSADLVTALAVVDNNPGGEPEFALYREGCADASYSAEEVATDVAQSCRILHVGSLSLGTPVSAAAQRSAVRFAKDAGALISVDVNFRPALWRSAEAMLATGREAVSTANVVKVSTEELQALTGVSNTADAVRALWHPELYVLAVTRGSTGAELFTRTCHVAVPGFSVEVVDTVGCGDAFMAAMLAGLLVADCLDPGTDKLRVIGLSACAAGAIVAGAAGAMEHMPTAREIAALADVQ